MELLEFIEKINDKDVVSSLRYIGIKSNNYYPIFISFMVNSVARNTNNQVIKYEVSDLSLDEIKTHLSMTMLGQRCIYWIQNLSEVEPRFLKEFLLYVEQASYEHLLIIPLDLIAPLKETNGGMLITIPDHLNDEHIIALTESMLEEKDHLFMQRVIKYRKKIDPDTLFLLQAYARVLGRRVDLFFDTWYDRVIEPEHSLFSLSQLLFGKQRIAFYKSWQIIRPQYAEEFWIVFWLEQFWQAMIFMEQTKKIGPQEARKYVSRLPFSFMQKDYRFTQISTLQRTYEFLYTVDHDMKNGAGSHGIDLALCHYFK